MRRLYCGVTMSGLKCASDTSRDNGKTGFGTVTSRQTEVLLKTTEESTANEHWVYAYFASFKHQQEAISLKKSPNSK